MNAFKIFCAVALSLALAVPAFGKSASRTRLFAAPDPSRAGEAVELRAEVDGLLGGAPKGTVRFVEGAVILGEGTLSRHGAGQETFAAGQWHSCALSAAGGLRCWGSNDYGQLGDNTERHRPKPVDVRALAQDVVAVAARYFHTCALTGAGAVRCWGWNGLRQVKQTIRSEILVPTSVSGLSGPVVSIAVGKGHSCALTNAGAVECWGWNSKGQLGRPAGGGSVPGPVSQLSRDIVAITAGESHTCALTSAGAVFCWGANNFGQLGDGTFGLPRHTPVAISGLSSGVVAIAAGSFHTCALTSAGAVFCWGANSRGELGDGTDWSRNTPVKTVSLSSGVVAITGGLHHTCALTSAGSAKCWGDNGSGQLGDGTIGSPRYTPVAVSGLSSGVVAISAGHFYSCAVTVAGAKCWGENWSNGTPSPVERLTPLLRARARLSTGALAVGAHSLRAIYLGDALHSSSGGSQSHKVVP